MNPDVNPDVNQALNQIYSDLQLQFLQQLRILPLHTQLEPGGYVAEVVAAAPILAPPATETPDWQLADPTLPLVQDILQLLQCFGVPAQWFYSATAGQVQLTSQGLFSAPPESYHQATAKQALWQQLCVQLQDTGPDPVEAL